MQHQDYITGSTLPQDIPADIPPTTTKKLYSQKEYHNPQLSDPKQDVIVEDLLSIEKNRQFSNLIKSHSLRQYKRLCNCGHYLFQFQSKSTSTPVFIRSGCKSDLCIRCNKHDNRKQKRVIDYIGLSLIDYAVWIKIIITIPLEFRDKYFADYKSIDPFMNKSWDIIKTEYGIWHGLERYDKGGGILSMHWMGDKTTNYNPHLEILVPAIRNGLSFEPKQSIDQFNQRKNRIRSKISKVLSSITGEDVGIERTNARILFKRNRKSKIHAIKYQVRNTINILKVMELSESVQKFLIDGRWGKKSVRYKGKAFGTEIRGWYSYLGLDYEIRNGEKKNTRWNDIDGNEYKYTGHRHTVTHLKGLGLGLQKLTSSSYCYKDQTIISEKASEVMKNAISTNHKVGKGAFTYLKKCIGGEFKIDWIPSVLEYAKELKFYQLIDPELATGESKRLWSKIKITPVINN